MMSSVSSRSILLALLMLQAALLAYPGWTKNLNQTEIGHLGATVYLWNTLRFDVFHVNPPLSRMASGLPLVIGGAAYDGKSYSSRPRDRCEWPLGLDYLAANAPKVLRVRIALARWALIPILLLGGYWAYGLSRELYGVSAGFLCLLLWCSSPLVLGWGATMCPDAAAAAMGVAAVAALRKWLRAPVVSQAIIAGVCLGLLPLTKTTWSIAFGLWPLLWLLWVVLNYWKKSDERARLSTSLRQLVLLLLVGLWTLNMGYFFEGTLRPLGQFRFQSRLLTGYESLDDVPRDGANRFAGMWLAKVPVPLPAEFLQGIDTQRYDFERQLPSYLRGQWADHGWWYYYLYAMAVKVPLGTWCLLILAICVTILGRGWNAAWRDEMLVLVPGIAVLVFVSSQTGFSMHSRYVIPALPFLLVWTSKVGRVFEIGPLTHKRRVIAVVVLVALTWTVGSSLWTYPHSLSYFNELTGGPKGGGEHLLGSNVDWGQDLLYLRDWLDDHPDVTLHGLALYGSYPTALAGIPETPHPPWSLDADHAQHDSSGSANSLGPKPGWYALSVNRIYGRDGRYRYFPDYFVPVGAAGYSISIFDITFEDANRARRELGLRQLPEKGELEMERVLP